MDKTQLGIVSDTIERGSRVFGTILVYLQGKTRFIGYRTAM